MMVHALFGKQINADQIELYIIIVLQFLNLQMLNFLAIDFDTRVFD